MSVSSVAMDYDRGYYDGYQDGVAFVLEKLSPILVELSGAVGNLQEALSLVVDSVQEEQPNADVPTV